MGIFLERMKEISMDKKQNAKVHGKSRGNQREHEFAEELADGGVRDQVMKRQSKKSCGGL